MIWNNKLWGIEYTMSDGEIILIGNWWHRDERGVSIVSDRPRALLFVTRKSAREWINSKNHFATARGALRIVRVREIVERWGK